MRKLLVILMTFISSLTLKAEEINVSEILFGHIGDSYGWHITEWNGRHVVIPLPCIVKSSSGWHFFMSSRIGHGREYEGLFIAEDGRYADKIVERGPDGELVRPFATRSDRELTALLRSSGIHIHTLSHYYHGEYRDSHMLVVNYALLSEDNLAEALEKLAGKIQD